MGYLEYGRALNYLDRLVSKCDKYELEAVDEIVRSEPEFAIYLAGNELDAAAQRTAKNANQRSHSKPSSNTTTSQRKRHGLRWLTALARVELGAMYAGFSESPRPFSHAGFPGYDAREVHTLLAEASRLHYSTLNNDAYFLGLRRKFRINSMTLAYLRRLNIATAFALASMQTLPPNRARDVLEFKQYGTQLSEARTGLRTMITAYLAEQNAVNTRLSRSSNERILALTELCNAGVCRQFSSVAESDD